MELSPILATTRKSWWTAQILAKRNLDSKRNLTGSFFKYSLSSFSFVSSPQSTQLYGTSFIETQQTSIFIGMQMKMYGTIFGA